MTHPMTFSVVLQLILDLEVTNAVTVSQKTSAICTY